jgi:hypothetical protein
MSTWRGSRIAYVSLALAVVLIGGFNVAGTVNAIAGNSDADSGKVDTINIPVSIPINLPQGYTTLGISSQVAFVHSGTLGLVPTTSPDGSSTLFSFSMSNGQIAGSADLTADFGVSSSWGSAVQNPLEYLQSFDGSGLVAVYGQDGAGDQTVVMFECSQEGALSRLWAQSFPAPPSPSSTPAVQFNADGSKLYTYYTVTKAASGDAGAEGPLGGSGLTQETTRRFPLLVFNGEARGLRPSVVVEIVASYIVLIDSADGSVADTFQVPTTPLDSGPVHGLVFDVQSDRLVALVGASIYVFQDIADQVRLAAKITPAADVVGVAWPIGVVGGRFLASFGGGPMVGDYFFCTDLDAGPTTSLFIPGNREPYANLVSLDQPDNSILVPYSLILSTHADDLDIINGTPRCDLLSISANGALVRSSRTVLPPGSTSAPNVFRLGDNATASRSGAMCFLAAWSGNMFTADAETGDVLNQMSLAPSPLQYLALDSATDQIVFGAGTSMGIFEAPDHPTISSVDVKDSQTTIEGASFLSGATVTINGVSAPIVGTSPTHFGREIIVGLGKANLPKGQHFAVVVTNRDGLSSNSFSFER